MSACGVKCLNNFGAIPSLCLNGILLVYLAVLISKQVIRDGVFNFIVAMLTLLTISTLSLIVYEALYYRAIQLYLITLTDGSSTDNLLIKVLRL